MKQEEVEKFLLKIIKIGIFITLFTPLILGPFGINFAEYPKAVFFRSLIEIISVFYISLILFDRRYLPKKSILLASLLLFYAVMFVSSIFGINFYRSFFGDMPRGEGLIMHLHLLVFFVIITSVFLKREEWLNLLKASVLVSGLSSLIALLQQMKAVTFYGMYLPRLSGTMSNPDLFACYIVLSIFITIFLLVAENKRNLKFFWSFLIALNCYTLFFSYTRGSWVGFAIGFVFLIFLNFLRFTKRNKILLCSGLIIFCVIVLIFFLNLNWLKDNVSSLIITNISNNLNNLDGRVDMWKAALVAIKDKPILGWGFESFAFVSDKFMSGLGNGMYCDRVHNKILEVLVYGGIIGFAAYLLIFVIIFQLIFKYAKLWDGYNERPKIIYTSILAGFFVAYFVQNIFAFDNIGTYILFFLVAGFINNNFSNLPEYIGKKNHLNYKNHNYIFFLKIIIIIIIFFLIVWIFYDINLKPTVVAMYFPDYSAYENADVKMSLYESEKVISMNTVYDDDLRLDFTDRLLYSLNNEHTNDINESIYNDLLKMKPFFNQDIKSNDEQINHIYQSLARISEEGYVLHKDPSDLSDMEQILQKADSFNPNVAGSNQLMGELKILQNNYSEGEEYIKKSCILDNSDDAVLYKRIGLAYFKKGDINLAVKNFEKVIDINYERKKQTPESAGTSLSNAKFIDYVASIYCKQLNDIQDCQRIYNKGSEIYPDYTDAFKWRLETMILESNK